jgi:hypothetical protein
MVNGQPGNEPGYGQAGIAETFARAQLVSGRGRAFNGMPRQPEVPGDAGCDDGRPVANHDQAVERPDGGRLEDGGHRGVLVVEADRNRLVLPRILNQVTPIRREDEFGPEPRAASPNARVW